MSTEVILWLLFLIRGKKCVMLISRCWPNLCSCLLTLPPGSPEVVSCGGPWAQSCVGPNPSFLVSEQTLPPAKHTGGQPSGKLRGNLSQTRTRDSLEACLGGTAVFHTGQPVTNGRGGDVSAGPREHGRRACSGTSTQASAARVGRGRLPGIRGTHSERHHSRGPA